MSGYGTAQQDGTPCRCLWPNNSSFSASSSDFQDLFRVKVVRVGLYLTFATGHRPGLVGLASRIFEVPVEPQEPAVNSQLPEHGGI